MWRKLTLPILVPVLLFLLFATTAEASTQVTVNGKTLTFDSAPIVQQGRTLVPLRAIFEALGATVDWQPAAKTVTATKNDTVIQLIVGGQAYKNGQEVTLDVPAKIINGRTLVPLRFVSEALGATVDWNNGTIAITAAASAYQLIDQANQALKNAPAYAMDISIKMDMNTAGQTKTVISTGTIKEARMGRDNVGIAVNLNVAATGQAQADKYAYYYQDGYYYINAQGKKVKIAMPLEDALKQSNAAALNLQESMIKEQKITGKTLSFQLNESAVKQLLGSTWTETLGLLKDPVKMNINSMNITATLDDHNQLSAISMQLSATAGYKDGKTTAINYTLDTKVTQIGGNVTVPFPGDLNTYTEVVN